MKKIKLFLILGIWFLLPGMAHALTLAQIRTEVRLRIRDTNTVRERYTDTQLNNLINEAQRDAINKTWSIQTSTSFDTVIGTTYYAFPSDFITPSRVTANNVNLPETSIIKLDGDNQGTPWETLTGTPLSYFINDASTNHFGVYPFPADSASTEAIKMYYYCQAANLSADSDQPFNGHEHLQQYSDLLIFYPTYRVYLIEGDTNKATIYRQEYESRLVVMEEDTGKRPNYTPSMSGPANSR